MNAERRQGIVTIVAELETIRDEEQEAFDNLPENFQNSEQGELRQEGIDKLNEAIEALEQIE